ncbi:bifunctional methylenetetrahydrofolate dehydrogenase/methenyltetrahydrofolate cyclohydrolase FolD [Croceicoccus sp. F390]|uniref:Bifunctional protein FolD n=1 Tax=Croceicoccus esteveae TaxID=3075597 RepID=A0ABU2ZFN2_9SPHN|nr:bifunctional methylenetetrahydrofolate dehydrogenase/methenyltetrahydrofolate cyclohydrolase FolD [Croceicoccus sp. F390]MDT0575409.1 bifunctional methylenetetrahydrofolate dehydrogenase/methenyltetrahydrofolate cyclohydrolase FolD [Croceicoccus sp. F390]
MARLIDGKAFAARLRTRIADETAEFVTDTGRRPGLAVVLVGDYAASQVYVRAKQKACEEAGMSGSVHRLAPDTTQAELLAVIARLNADAATDGILVQLPLPDAIDADAVIQAIDPAKDVDGFTTASAGRLLIGLPGLVACTPLGCLMLLKEVAGDLAGKTAVVIGRSDIVGKPMALLLLRESCTVTVAHSRTQDLPAVVRSADIVVAAVGRPEMVKGSWLKPGAIVIDVGINRVPAAAGKTRLVGDVDFDEAEQVAGAITPVPGGVGPMTIACLLHNTLKAARSRAGLNPTT